MRITVWQVLIAMTVYCALFALLAPLLIDGSWLGRGLLVLCVLATPFLLSPVAAVLARMSRRAYLAVLFACCCVLVGATSLFLESDDLRVREQVNIHPACPICLKGVAFAVHAYRDRHGVFPPRVIKDEHGRPMHSWRVLVAPYLEAPAELGAYDFSVAWNRGSNKRLQGLQMHAYKCPYCAANNKTTSQTTVVAVTDDHAVFSADEDAICLVGITRSGIHWLEPRDLTVADLVDNGNNWLVSSEHGAGVWICQSDGGVRFLLDSCTRDELQRLVAGSGHELDTERLYGKETRGNYWLERAQERAQEKRGAIRWLIVGVYVVVISSLLPKKTVMRPFPRHSSVENSSGSSSSDTP